MDFAVLYLPVLKKIRYKKGECSAFPKMGHHGWWCPDKK
jgi:hypothetical protein